jgi:hypothetical protein
MNHTLPENDPVAVALIAQGFLAQCGDRREAIEMARNLIAACRREIPWLAEEEAIWSEAMEACGGYWDNVPMPEERFLRLLCAELTKETRIDRLRRFARRWWANVRNKYDRAPDITDPAVWTSATLHSWHRCFETVVKSGRTATKRANAEKK